MIPYIFTSLHLSAAFLIFLLVNWIGRHAVEFGYSSASLFEDGEESIALNIFVKSLFPTVCIVIISSILVAFEKDSWRIGINRIVYIYFLIRIIAIFALDRMHLVSWPKFFMHSAIGILVSEIAYKHLILPKNSLLPDLETVGNELWLAIFAFLYAIMNKVPLPQGPSVRRKNSYVTRKYRDFQRSYGSLINTKVADSTLRLTIYAIMIAEDYARPRIIRYLENALPWGGSRTTGVMQVRSGHALSDQQSVELGVASLVQAWEKAPRDETGKWTKFRDTVITHNRDDDYVYRVLEIARIIAKRADRTLETAYDEIG
jgi:hypothetical protein